LEYVCIADVCWFEFIYGFWVLGWWYKCLSYGVISLSLSFLFTRRSGQPCLMCAPFSSRYKVYLQSLITTVLSTQKPLSSGKTKRVRDYVL
jgi:hypothetical protein